MNHDKLKNLFDEWATNGRDTSMENGHSDVVEQVIAGLEIGFGEQILDLGCGNGWATRLLAKSAAGSGAVGVDASPKMIARAQELHSFTIRAKYEAAPFEDLPFKDGQFDRAFSMEAIYYAVDLQKALSELARVLKPGAQANLVLDFYAGRPGVAGWPSRLGLDLVELDETDWVAALHAAGFQDGRAERVIDRRGLGEEANFEPSEWWPSFADRRAYHDAGSLHLIARRA